MDARIRPFEPNIPFEQLARYRAQLTALNRALNNNRRRRNRRVRNAMRVFVAYRNLLAAIVEIGGNNYTPRGRFMAEFFISLLT